ncbi:MAG TPA: Flp pilus assembly protein CpaB [Blastocatellia bacterium]|nr:Flp pilus assembly protein CpaB [Blastocatellia bacterium]
MRDKRLIVVLVLAMVAGLIAAISVSRYLSKVEGGSQNIVVAKVKIPLSTKITIEQLTTAQLPREATPEGTFEAPEKLVGRVAMTDIAAREPLTTAKLAPEGSDGGLSAMIPDGYRAIAVKVDEIVGIAGLVMPGSWVDVVAVVDPSNDAASHGPTSKIVLQHIKVLATDQNIDKQNQDKGVLSVKAVTLMVTPEEAEKLALASTEGKLQLVMRNSVDKEDVPTVGTNKRSLLVNERLVLPPESNGSQAAAPTPKPVAKRRTPILLKVTAPEAGDPKAAKTEQPQPTPPRNSVEVIQGMKRQTIDLP